MKYIKRHKGLANAPSIYNSFVFIHSWEKKLFLQKNLINLFENRGLQYSCYRPQRSCGQGYVFTGVCHSVNAGEGMSASVHAGIPSPGADTPPPGADTPPGADPSPGQTPPVFMKKQ